MLPALDGGPGGSDGTPVPYKSKQTGLELYDLDNDVNETTNVLDQYPEVVKELQNQAEIYRNQLGDKLQKRVGSQVRGPGKLE